MPLKQEHIVIVRSESAPAIPPPLAGEEPPEIKLSTAQQRALERVLKGEKAEEIARAIGVDRSTLYRWRTYNPHFIAALNRERGRLQAETRDRLLVLSARATDTVSESVADGNAQLGLRVLEKMGCLKPGPDHPVDPYAVFGMGLDDETVRHPIGEGFRAVSRAMTPEQRRRAPQLLALGVIIENRRAGRATPLHILEMAGPLAQEVQVPQEPAAGANDAGLVCTTERIEVKGAAGGPGLLAGGKGSAPPRVKANVSLQFTMD